MNLRRITLEDFEEVVQMYYDFTVEVFGSQRKISPKYFYYKAVIDWINSSKDVIIAEKDSTIVGFSMAYVDDFGGLTEPVYNGEIAYVKPEYRKTRAGYMLYKNVVAYADEIKMTLVANGRVDNGVDKMIEKHFDCKRMFINVERNYNGW